MVDMGLADAKFVMGQIRTPVHEKIASLYLISIENFRCFGLFRSKWWTVLENDIWINGRAYNIGDRGEL